jgi:hypothetical protein
MEWLYASVSETFLTGAHGIYVKAYKIARQSRLSRSDPATTMQKKGVSEFKTGSIGRKHGPPGDGQSPTVNRPRPEVFVEPGNASPHDVVPVFGFFNQMAFAWINDELRPYPDSPQRVPKFI